MSNKPVIESLKKLLADSYTLALKTQNYHWNVEGEQFATLHALFEAQYGELSAAIDEVAERIRALGEKSPGSYAAFSKLTVISEGDGDLDAPAMVKDLYHSHQQIIKTLNAAFEKADKAGDEGSADLCVGRLRAHEKAAWMLKSSLPAAHRSKLAA
jgi:starvation-inducible DNA-binding protein